MRKKDGIKTPSPTHTLFLPSSTLLLYSWLLYLAWKNCSSMGFPQVAMPSRKSHLLRCRYTGCSVDICYATDLFTGFKGICASPPGVTLPTFLLTSVFTGLFLILFLPYSSLPCSIFALCFPWGTTVLAEGLSWACNGSVGAIWNWAAPESLYGDHPWSCLL